MTKRVKWTKTGFNTWRRGEFTVYLANLPHDVYFVTHKGVMQKFLSREAVVEFIEKT